MLLLSNALFRGSFGRLFALIHLRYVVEVLFCEASCLSGLCMRAENRISPWPS